MSFVQSKGWRVLLGLRTLLRVLGFILFGHIKIPSTIRVELLLIPLHLLLMILSKLFNEILSLLKVGFKLFDLHWGFLLMPNIAVQLGSWCILMPYSATSLQIDAFRLLIISTYIEITPSGALSILCATRHLVAVVLTLTWTHIQHRTELLLTTLWGIGMLGGSHIAVVLRSHVLFLVPIHRTSLLLRHRLRSSGYVGRWTVMNGIVLRRFPTLRFGCRLFLDMPWGRPSLQDVMLGISILFPLF